MQNPHIMVDTDYVFLKLVSKINVTKTFQVLAVYKKI